MNACISQSCTMTTPFAEDLSRSAEGGAQAVEVWLTKLETHLKTQSLDDTLALLAERLLTPAAAAVQGGLLLSRGEQRSAHWDHFKRRLDLCERFRIPTLIISADPVANRSERAESLGIAMASLGEAAHWAAGFGVKLAFEFQGTGAVCTTLETAARIVNEINHPHLGLCLDAFHFFQGPSKESDLSLVSTDNLFHVQLCDVAGVPRELMTDSDRIFPGEGDFPLAPLVRRLREIQYAGFVSLELTNPVLWQAKPTQVVELGLTALNRTLSL
ncbi:MAG: sugar phosphate isomerase/epimerase [Gemmataceae bacterium]